MLSLTQYQVYLFIFSIINMLGVQVCMPVLSPRSCHQAQYYIISRFQHLTQCFIELCQLLGASQPIHLLQTCHGIKVFNCQKERIHFFNGKITWTTYFSLVLCGKGDSFLSALNLPTLSLIWSNPSYRIMKDGGNKFVCFLHIPHNFTHLYHATLSLLMVFSC